MPTTAAGTPKTVEGAIQRFEKYLHGVGNQDLDVVCDVAGPGAKKAEAKGFGTCRQTFPITFQMLGAAKRTALQTATIDAKQVRQRANGDVDIPAKAIRASVTIGERDLGDAVLSYRDGTWFVID
ncbi:hypothetical protein GCM10022247_67920 [Allokutzneria multivorans]|uniref:Nuclear transport factor 2 family protein n=1 Tax=Allokutzneria multivorans TaxID=1142134 RepID=A0ABP7TZ37_9PSEU